jgi:hypothetical protein
MVSISAPFSFTPIRYDPIIYTGWDTAAQQQQQQHTLRPLEQHATYSSVNHPKATPLCFVLAFVLSFVLAFVLSFVLSFVLAFVLAFVLSFVLSCLVAHARTRSVELPAGILGHIFVHTLDRHVNDVTTLVSTHVRHYQ